MVTKMLTARDIDIGLTIANIVKRDPSNSKGLRMKVYEERIRNKVDALISAARAVGAEIIYLYK